MKKDVLLGISSVDADCLKWTENGRKFLRIHRKGRWILAVYMFIPLAAIVFMLLVGPVHTGSIERWPAFGILVGAPAFATLFLMTVCDGVSIMLFRNSRRIRKITNELELLRELPGLREILLNGTA